MIKKIICPTDFSKCADNAIEYAANLAQTFNAELLLVNVQTITVAAAAASLGEGIGAEAREGAQQASEKLKFLCAEAKDMFQIEAEFEVDLTAQSLVSTLTDLGGENSLIVMGTNGVDGMYDYFFGTQAYQVIRNAKCPVLVVPESASYSPVRKMAFAWDYNSKSEFSFSQLNEFQQAFNPYFEFLHISNHTSGLGHDLFRALRDEIELVLGKDHKVTFKQLYSDDIPGSIDSYMLESRADILAITYYNRGFIRDMFHGTVAKELSGGSEYPILVVHA
jgi:nucleotide-binding universal stress UspA family protein